MIVGGERRLEAVIPCRRLARKHHNRGWGSAGYGVERRRREEDRESVLNNCLVQNELKQKYLAEN